MGSDGDSGRHTAEYGNLLLEVSLRNTEEIRVFDYVVTDTDGFACWEGSASDLASAQSDAVIEAQLFLDPYIASPPAPQWRRDAKPGTQT